MKKLPVTAMNYGELYQILTGPIKTKLMMTGIELKIFNRLETFRSAEDVARDAGTHPENTQRFLDALATMDLVEKERGLYRNLPVTRTFLSEDSPVYLGKVFLMVEKRCDDSLKNLRELVKRGPAGDGPEKDFASQELWAEFSRTTAAWAMGGIGRRVASILSELPGFSGFQHMLDLGGGHGMFALYIVNAHPSMKGIVFDRPAVVEVAKEFIHEYDMEDRVAVAAGDFMTDDIGADYDLVWASATLNFAKWNMDALIKKIHKAVKPGGYFISFQDGMTHEHTKPETMLGHLADQLKTGVDFSLDQGFVADAMIRCGFRSVRSHTIDTPMGAMDMDIAHK
jgi:SAM-dependent methyltransferase